MANKDVFAEKLIFFYDAFKNRLDIAGNIWNPVFMGFWDKFYKDERSNKVVLANFKKYMKIAAENRGHSIVVGRVDQMDRHDFGVRNLWVVVYNQ